MPELPEVETVRRQLATRLPGLTISALRICDLKVSAQDQNELAALVVGRRVCALRRRGKYLIVDCEASLLIVHLRMTGQLLFKPEDEPRRPRYVIEFGPETSLFFYDVRRFGTLTGLPAAGEAAYFSALGPEPFSAEFSARRLRDELAGRRAPLKSILLDQRRLAGVGNIYADEALFRARLHPLRMGGSVGPREAQRLHAAILETLQAGIDHEGSSIESFVDPAGERGSFQEILNVYQRTGEPCRVCGTVVQRIKLGGRGTHFCPRCQPRRGGIAPTARHMRAVSRPPRTRQPPSFAPPQ